MKHLRWISLVICAVVLAVLVISTLRHQASVQVTAQSPSGTTTGTVGNAAQESRGETPRITRMTFEDPRGRQDGTIDQAWAALGSIEKHLLSNEDPDTWVDDLVAMDKVIRTLPDEALATLVRTARQHVDRRIADWLVPVLYFAVGHVGFGNTRSLLAERIADESPRTLWGIVLGLAAAPTVFDERFDREFWLNVLISEPLIRDPDYPARYQKRSGTIDYKCPFGILPSDFRPALVDRIERIPKADLLAETTIFSAMYLGKEDVTAERAAKWVKDTSMHPSFRVWAITSLDGRDPQALDLARARLVMPDEDTAFIDGMVGWLETRSWDGNGVPPPNAFLVDVYYRQKAAGMARPRLIEAAVLPPGSEAARIAGDVLSSVPGEQAQLAVLAALRDQVWDAVPVMAPDRQSLLMEASRSSHEQVRLQAIMVLASKASDGFLPDKQAVSARLGEMAGQDPSYQVRCSAKSAMDRMADGR